MKIEHFKQPVSSFLTIDKDLSELVDLLCENERLKKLLYYESSDALQKPNLTPEQTQSLYGKQIKLVPKFKVDDNCFSYLLLQEHNFSESSNPEFRNSTLEVDIICHFDSWELKDFSLRPYKIAAEIDSILKNTKLSGMGKLTFVYGDTILLTSEFGGICLSYDVVHGGEDEFNASTPEEEKDLLSNFNKLFNIEKDVFAEDE